MNIIENNPFRIAGIFANSNEKELQKNKSKISRYASVGKDMSFDVDFPFFCEISRNEENLQNAISKLQQSKDKVHYGMFWFLNINSIDNTAINYLINGDKQKALKIWAKVKEKPINNKTFSAYSNMGTLLLAGNSLSTIRQGVNLKVQLIRSDSLEAFVQEVGDKTYSVSTEKQLEYFMSEVLSQFDKMGYSPKDELSVFDDADNNTKELVIKSITSKPISNIETYKESTNAKRKDNEGNALKNGRELLDNTKQDIEFLKETLRRDNVQYKQISDDLAKEILECGIDYFNYWQETDDVNMAKKVLSFLKDVRTIDVNQHTSDRINDNINSIKEWIEDVKELEKEKSIDKELKYINAELKDFQSKVDTVQEAEILIDMCTPKLQEIKQKIGKDDYLYLKISSAVVSNALGMLISAVNKAQEERVRLSELYSMVSNAYNITIEMESMDMNSNLRRQLENNINILNNIKHKVKSNVKVDQHNRTMAQKNSSGCYIATMVYEDYDHPQVIKLRKYRDNILAHNVLGRNFIKIYYTFSPRLVKILQNRPLVNKVIKKTLDKLIK